MADLSDEQKLVLRMCMEAEKAGRDAAWISRDDLLDGKCTPDDAPVIALMRLTWAVLAMPAGILEWSADQRSFRLSDASLGHIRRRAEARRKLEKPHG